MRVVIGDTCGNIQGQVYIDNNGDCVFNGTDQPMVHELVRLLDNSNGNVIDMTYTNANGEYWFTGISSFTYDIEINNNLSFWFHDRLPIRRILYHKLTVY